MTHPFKLLFSKIMMVQVLLAGWSESAPEPQAIAAGEWATLFDRKSVEGWSVKANPTDTEGPYWRIEDGNVVDDSHGEHLKG